MFIRPCYRKKNGKRHAYWALCESVRTKRGPRQRVVACLGQLDEQGRLGVQDAADGRRRGQQRQLFDDVRPQWVEVDASRVRVENCRRFGGPWLGLEPQRRDHAPRDRDTHGASLRPGGSDLGGGPRHGVGEEPGVLARKQPCCPAWTVKLQEQATDALRPSYDQLAAALPEQPRLGIDETPGKEGPHKTWLWTFVAARFTVFGLRLTRAATVLTELLTDRFGGVVMCDRAKMYWLLKRLQWCWAHLKRDFQALIDHDDRQVKRLGHDLMRPTRKLFAAWARCRDGTISRARMKRLMQPIRAEIEGLLLRGAFSGNDRLAGMCDELYDHRQWLWTFLDHEGVEPTNNSSERALRHAVTWRKLSFGTQSAKGSRFVETMLTVIETCRQQQRNTFTFVADALQAHFAGRPAPSLLPRV